MEFYTDFKFSNHFCIPETTNPCDFPLDKALNYKQACDTAEQAIKAFLKKKKVILDWNICDLVSAGDTKNCFLMNIASGTIIYFEEAARLNRFSKGIGQNRHLNFWLTLKILFWSKLNWNAIEKENKTSLKLELHFFLKEVILQKKFPF